MKISVRTLQNAEGELDIEPYQSIKELKQAIEKHVFPHLAAIKQIIVHAGRVLGDEKLVSDYNVRENDRLIVMLSHKPAPKTAAASVSDAETTAPPSATITSDAAPPAADSSYGATAATSDDRTQITTAALTPPEPSASKAQQTTVTATASESAPDTDAVGKTPVVSTETATSGDPTGAPATQIESGVEVTAYEAAASAFYGGDALDGTISQICAMGFPREKVEEAMRAAFHNPDRAVEYLMTGIPETAPIPQQHPPPIAPTQQVPQQPQPAAHTPAVQPSTTGPPVSSVFPPMTSTRTTTGTGQAGLEVPGGMPAPGGATPIRPLQTGGVGVAEGEDGPLASLRHHHVFEQMRRAVQGNPQVLPQLLMAIGEQNPQLAELIINNQDEFLRMLSAPPEGGAALGEEFEGEGEGGDAGARIQLHFTPEEMEAIQRLEALGFPRGAAAQAYIACDKNEELAANFLFDNIEDIYSDEQGGDQPPSA